MKALTLLEYKPMMVILAVILSGTFSIHAQVSAVQNWTGIIPPPANGTSYTLEQVVGGTWDTSANWANAVAGTSTDYYALTSGVGRVASFQGVTNGYTVTIGDSYTVPVIRALQLSFGANATVTIQSNIAKNILFATTNTPYINVSAGKELRIGPNTAFTFFGTGTRLIHKYGAGTLRWSGSAAAFNDTLLLTAGKFIIDSNASSRLGSSAILDISGGEFQYNGSEALNSSVSLNSGKISGTGHISSAVQVGSNSIIAPGDTVGIQHYDHLTFASAGTYEWEIGSWAGENAGEHFDQIQVDDFSVSAVGDNPFTISLRSVGGALSDFNAAINRSWTLLESDSSIAPGILDGLVIDSTFFATWNALDDGEFSLAVNDNALELIYTPAAIPEPSSILLIGFALILIFPARYRIVHR